MFCKFLLHPKAADSLSPPKGISLMALFYYNCINYGFFSSVARVLLS